MSALNPTELPNLLSSQKLSCCKSAFPFFSVPCSVSCRSVNTTPARHETRNLKALAFRRLGNGECDCDSQELFSCWVAMGRGWAHLCLRIPSAAEGEGMQQPGRGPPRFALLM